MKNRNTLNKLMDKDTSDLNQAEKQQRTKANKIGKALKNNESDYKDIVGEITLTKGVPMSQHSAYEKGHAVDKHGKSSCSQDYLKYFERGDMSSDDDE